MSKVFEAVAKDGVIVLPADVPSSSRCLVALLDEDIERLREDAALSIPEPSQQRMSELLQRNRDGELTSQERAELDALSHEFDTATLTKGRALSILAQLDSRSERP
jgi:hypothetical protein